MTTQLRLVEPPEPRPRPARAGSTSARSTTGTRARTAAASARGSRTARSARTVRGGRRSASWGDWRLDARTRQVGRAGVARAREILDAVAEQELSQAS